MQAHTRGDIPHNKVTRINKSSITVKYKAEVACQSFKSSIESTNNQIQAFKLVYCPHLRKLQDLEQGRIDFVKATLEKVAKTIATLGVKFSEESVKMGEQSTFVNSETDIKMFINEHKSDTDLPQTGSLDMQVQAQDYSRYKQILAEIQEREQQRMKEEEEEQRIAQEC